MLNYMLGTSACFTDRGPHFQGRLWPRRSSATVRTAVDLPGSPNLSGFPNPKTWSICRFILTQDVTFLGF